MGIDISLNVGINGETSSISASGNLIEPISDKNINVFGIDSGTLTKILQKNYSKYLIINPYHFDYKKVMCNIEVTSAEILGVTSQPIIIKTQEFSNNSDVEATFNVSITDSVSNTSSSTWSTGGSFTVTQKVSYGLKFGASGETSMSYTQTWGIGGTESITYTVGSTSGVTVKLQPGQAIIAELSSSRGVLKAKINYNAYVTGKVNIMSMGLPPLAEISIEELMQLGDIKNSIKSDETMEVGYYSNAKINIKNKETNQLISTHYL